MTVLLFGDLRTFVLFTVLLMGGAAYLTGQAIAATWRPPWQAIGYSLLLGVADRFLVFALFDGTLLSPPAFVIDTGIITAICLMSYRLTRVARMVSQYPWLYERAGLFRWRERSGG
jgi:branched-chain amino acid transport system ATP-binding protein